MLPMLCAREYPAGGEGGHKQMTRRRCSVQTQQNWEWLWAKYGGLIWRERRTQKVTTSWDTAAISAAFKKTGCSEEGSKKEEGRERIGTF